MTDPESGQEAILGAFSGQVITKETFSDFGLTIDMQNHTVIYYDAVSATMLNKLWADPFKPNRGAVSFPEGGMVVKAAGVTPTPDQWPVARRLVDLERLSAHRGSAHWTRRQSYTNAKPVVVASPRACSSTSSSRTRSPRRKPVGSSSPMSTTRTRPAAPHGTSWFRSEPCGATIRRLPAIRTAPIPNGGPLAGDMDQSGGAGLRQFVPRLGWPAVGTDRRGGAPQRGVDRRDAPGNLACFVLVPQLPRHGAVPLRLQPLSFAEQDIPPRGFVVSDVPTGLGDVVALVPEQAGVASPERQHRRRSRSTTTC